MQETDFAVADQEAPKRAIIKPAPTCFTVEVLAPAKQGEYIFESPCS